MSGVLQQHGRGGGDRQFGLGQRDVQPGAEHDRRRAAAAERAELGEDAGDLPAPHQDVVGPFESAGNARPFQSALRAGRAAASRDSQE